MQALFKCKWDGDGLRKFDVNDFYELAHAFGADWEFNDQVRDPLAPGDIVLVPKPVADAGAEDEEIEEVVVDPEQD